MVGEKFSFSSGRDSHEYKSVILCPYCGTKTPIKFEFEGGGGGRLSCSSGFCGNFIVKCVNCENDTFIIIEDDIIVDQYPKCVTKVALDVPQDIREDFEEADKCFNSEAFKASVAMLRRALQKSCNELGANPKDRLVDQLENLYKNDKIPKPLYDLATEIRFFGNYGAHPQDDLLEKVTMENAKTVSEFLQHFFEYIYVTPAKVKRTREGRLMRKGKK
jgi:hypothetical protein